METAMNYLPRRRKRALKIEPCHALYKWLRDVHPSHLPPLFLFSFFSLLFTLSFPTAKIPRFVGILQSLRFVRSQ